MKWNWKKAEGLCWERLGYPCAQVPGNGSCMRCLVVKDFLNDPCDIKFDHQVQNMEEFVSFMIRVANTSSESNGGC